MAEALYPEEPPPSYESQFHYHTDSPIGMNAAPAPSAPPLHYPRSDRPQGATNNAATSLPVATPRRGYKTVSLQTPQEKEDLSKSPLRRVPKRAPPPPPPMLNRSSSQPNIQSQNTRPSSSIQLGTNSDDFAHPQDTHSVPEAHFRSHHSRRQLEACRGSTSACTHPEYSQGQSHSMSLIPGDDVAFEQPHLYETLESFHHSQEPYTTVRPTSTNDPRSRILRQTSAPSVVRRYRQVTLLPQDSDQQPQPSQEYQSPHECQATINSPQANQSPHECQATINSPQAYQSPHECQATINSPQAYQSPHECQATINTVHTSPNTDMQTLHAQQVSHDVQTDDDLTAQHQPCSHHLPISSQSQALEVVTGTQPKPKPRNATLPTEQVALTQSYPMSSMPVLPGNQFTQHNAHQQFSVAQNITSFPGQTQLQTYSYAQQASVFTMPGLIQPPGHGVSIQAPGGIPMQLSAVPLQVPGVAMQPPAPLQESGVLMQTQGVQLSPTLLCYSSAQLNVPMATQQVRSGADELNAGAIGQGPIPRARSHSESHPPLLDEQTQGPPSSHGEGVLSRSPVRQPVPRPRKGKHTGREGTGSAQLPAQDGVEVTLSGANLDENQETGLEAPAKPPRRYVRKPAPLPPANRPNNHVTVGPLQPEASPLPEILPEGATSLPEGTTSAAATVLSNTGSLCPGSDTSLLEAAALLPGDATSLPEAASLDTRTATCSRQPATPSGYKITDIFFSGNVIYLLSLSDPLRLPLRASGSKLKGRSSFKNYCKFEIVFLSSAIGHEQSVLVVMLKCFSRINRYLAINQKGKVQITKGSAEKCKFVVHEVTERPLLRYGVVTLESAIYPGWFISVSSSGKTRRCKETRLSTKVDESRFAVRIERIFNPYSSPLMNFDRPSVMHQLRDRSVIQLQLRGSSQFLCVDIKGRLMNTGNRGEVTTQFVVIDRGMGVVSLRSKKFPKVWLCVKQSKVQGNGKPNLSADFCISESPDGSVQFETIVSPGIYLSSPCETRARGDLQDSKDFIIKYVTPHRVL